MIGVAVGLGNVWRFPYMMGSYGGSAFLIVYLAFTLFFAVPALMAEMALGRAYRKGTLRAFQASLGPKWGSYIGGLLLLTVTVAGSYYAVVVGQVFYSTFFAISQGFAEANLRAYHIQLETGGHQYMWAALLIIIALLIVYRGLRDGIERVSRLFMPFFLLSMLYLVVHILSSGDARGHLWSFLTPDFGAMGSKDIFAALGQAFFSVGLGGTFVVVYSRYLDEHERLDRMAALTALGDVGASLLVSLFLVPAILLYGLDMTAGPGLLFDTIPHLFQSMPGGRLISILFLLSLSMVAMLSLIAAYEVVFGSAGMRWFDRLDRGTKIGLIGVIQLALALPSCLDADLIGTLDLIFGSGMQVLGSALSAFALAWGLGRVVAKQQLSVSQRPWTQGLFLWIKWIIPLTLLAVLLGYIWDSM